MKDGTENCNVKIVLADNCVNEITRLLDDHCEKAEKVNEALRAEAARARDNLTTAKNLNHANIHPLRVENTQMKETLGQFQVTNKAQNETIMTLKTENAKLESQLRIAFLHIL